MAANYWDSTQRTHWTFTKDQLDDMRSQQQQENQELYNKYPLPEPRLMNIYIQQREADRLQQPLATAQIYVRRFYTKVEMRRTNPYLVMTTAVYVACKVEECPIHIRLVLAEAARQWPELGINDISKIGECEFHLISTMSARMIVHHPYRTLNDLAPGLSMSTEETALSQNIINDHYNTDMPLMYPPHIIAVTAMFLAVVLRPTQSNLQAHAAATSSPAIKSALDSPNKIARLTDWMAASQIDIPAVMAATQEFLSLYEIAEFAQLGQLRQGRPDGLAWVELPDEHYAALDISQRHRSARLGSLREAGPQRLVWMDLSKECYAALDMVPGDESTSDHDTTDSSY
ncbi:C/H/G cyclin [Aureobasidium pullulans]|nr:C/H/G cyclin [Aureobasidium pullulans]